MLDAFELEAHLNEAGDKATVLIHPPKDGSPRGSMMSIWINGERIGERSEFQRLVIAQCRDRTRSQG